jgi:hypothetical protein
MFMAESMKGVENEAMDATNSMVFGFTIDDIL